MTRRYSFALRSCRSCARQRRRHRKRQPAPMQSRRSQAKSCLSRVRAGQRLARGHALSRYRPHSYWCGQRHGRWRSLAWVPEFQRRVLCIFCAAATKTTPMHASAQYQDSKTVASRQQNHTWSVPGHDPSALTKLVSDEGSEHEYFWRSTECFDRVLLGAARLASGEAECSYPSQPLVAQIRPSTQGRSQELPREREDWVPPPGGSDSKETLVPTNDQQVSAIARSQRLKQGRDVQLYGALGDA